MLRASQLPECRAVHLRPMILQPDAAPYGGCRSLLRSIRAMPEGSVRPLVVFPYSGDAVREYEEAGCDVELMPLAVLRRTSAGAGGMWRLVREQRTTSIALAKLAVEEKCDLVHTNSMSIISGGPAATRAGIPHVWQLREAPSDGGVFKRFMIRRLVRKADRVVAISRQAAVFGPARKTHIVRNGYDLPVGGIEQTSAVAALERIPDGLLVGMVGRISPTKAQHVAVEALGRSMRLVLAGDVYPGHEPYYASLRARVEGLGLHDRVIELGYLPRVEPLLERIDALVVATATGEGFCMAALEAMAHGVPVVSCATGGVEELVIDGRTGLWCEPGSVDDVADALRELRDDPALRARLGEGAREHARKFSVQRSADGLLREWRAAVRVR